MANKAFKYRLYPNVSQQILLSKTFGCARFVYNKCLEEQQRRYVRGEKYASYFEMSNYLVRVLKKEHEFLREVDKYALTNAARHLDAAYKRMFRHQGRHPKFKSKRKSRLSYTTNFANGNIKVLDNMVQLPKLGRVRAVVHRDIPADYTLKSATISLESDGSYYISVLYEYEEKIEPASMNNVVGLDYKSAGLYVSSDGECCNMPHYFRQSQPRLAKAQRKLKHKVKGSNNWEKQRRKIGKVHRHVANQRKDFLHKKSTEIANRYDVVCVEDLNLRAMSNKGFGNGKATLDNGYGMFLNMLEYKLQDRGKKLIKIDKWYPSSQVCSKCGQRKSMRLSERRYECPSCGAVIDRDLNAAINIRVEGLRLLNLLPSGNVG